MKTFKCKCGEDIIVDDDKLDQLSAINWSCTPTALHFHYRDIGISKSINIARLIISIPDGYLPDHKDGNIHNNQRNNLRVATHSQNGANRKMQANNTSGFRGVVKVNGQKRCWRAQIKVNGEWIYKRYLTPEDAAHEYDRLAIHYFGEFARTNFSPG